MKKLFVVLFTVAAFTATGCTGNMVAELNQ